MNKNKKQSKTVPTITKRIGIALVIIIAMLAALYPLSDVMRDSIDDSTRAALIKEGKAQQFIKTSLGTMHVRISGPDDGPVVLLVHGGVVGGYGYKNWQEPLAEAGYRVIVPDLLGYGYSDRPDIPYTKEFYVTQLRELLKGLDIEEPVNIVGASLGGEIVTAFAASSPDRIKSVLLVAPSGLGQDIYVSNTPTWPVIGDWIFRVLGASYTRNMMDKAYAQSPDRDNMANWMKEQTNYRGFGDGMLNTIRNYKSDWQPEDYEILGRSNLPVMAIWGTEDVVHPYTQTKELLARTPQTVLITLEGKGHAITFGETASILASAIPFIDKANGLGSQD